MDIHLLMPKQHAWIHKHYIYIYTYIFIYVYIIYCLLITRKLYLFPRRTRSSRRPGSVANSILYRRDVILRHSARKPKSGWISPTVYWCPSSGYGWSHSLECPLSPSQDQTVVSVSYHRMEQLDQMVELFHEQLDHRISDGGCGGCKPDR